MVSKIEDLTSAKGIEVALPGFVLGCDTFRSEKLRHKNAHDLIYKIESVLRELIFRQVE